MANRERGEQQFVVGDQTYVMRLNTAAACEGERRRGNTLRNLQLGATVRGSITDSCWLLWASLQDHHADTVKSLKDIHRIVDAAGGVVAVYEEPEGVMTVDAPPEQPGG